MKTPGSLMTGSTIAQGPAPAGERPAGCPSPRAGHAHDDHLNGAGSSEKPSTAPRAASPTCGPRSSSCPRRSARTRTSRAHRREPPAACGGSSGTVPRPRPARGAEHLQYLPDENPGAVGSVGNRYRQFGPFGFNRLLRLHPHRFRLAFLTLGAARPNSPGSVKARRGRGRWPSSRPPLP